MLKYHYINQPPKKFTVSTIKGPSVNDRMMDDFPVCGFFFMNQLMGEREEDEKGAFDIPIFTEEFLDHNKGQC